MKIYLVIYFSFCSLAIAESWREWIARLLRPSFTEQRVRHDTREHYWEDSGREERIASWNFVRRSGARIVPITDVLEEEAYA